MRSTCRGFVWTPQAESFRPNHLHLSKFQDPERPVYWDVYPPGEAHRPAASDRSPLRFADENPHSHENIVSSETTLRWCLSPMRVLPPLRRRSLSGWLQIADEWWKAVHPQVWDV